VVAVNTFIYILSKSFSFLITKGSVNAEMKLVLSGTPNKVKNHCIQSVI